MVTSHRQVNVLACLLATILIWPVAAQPPQDRPAGAGPKKPATADSHKSVADLPLPPESILVICPDLKQALQQLQPGAVVLSAEQYRRIMDQLAELKKAENKPSTDPPLSACRLTGEVVLPHDGSAEPVLDLRAELQFRTLRRDAVVPIGFPGVQMTDASLDGQPPVWGPDRNGLTVRVAEPRTCRLVLRMQVPVRRTAGEQRVQLERIPAAAITSLDLVVPSRVTQAQVAGVGPIGVEPLEGKTRLHAPALGVLTRLDLRWREASQPAPGEARPRVAVRGDFLVTIDDAVVDTELHLRIEPRRGTVSQLQFALSPDVVSVQVDSPTQEPPVWTFASSRLTLDCRQPLLAGGTPLELVVRWQQRRSGRSATPIRLAYFNLTTPGERIQTGTIAITRTGTEACRLRPRNVVRIDPREAGRRASRADSCFRYWQQPVALELIPQSTAALPQVVQVQVQHQLRATADALRLQSEFRIAPNSRGSVSTVDVTWPKGFELDKRIYQSALVNNITTLGGEPGRLRIRLTRNQTQPFSLRLEGLRPAASLATVELSLPTIVQVSTGQGSAGPSEVALTEGSLQIDSEDVELRLSEGTSGLVASGGRSPQLNLPLSKKVTLSLDTASGDSPCYLVLQRCVLRDTVTFEAEAFLTRDRIQVIETLAFRFVRENPSRVRLRVPAAIGDRLRVELVEEGADAGTEQLLTTRRLTASNDAAASVREVILPGDCGQTARLRVTFTLESPEATSEGTVAIPLVRAAATVQQQGQARIHVWTVSELAVSAVENPDWTTDDNSVAAAGNVRPQLTLSASDASRPLHLLVQAQGDHSSANAVIDQLMIRVRPLLSDKLAYHVQAQVSAVRTSAIEFTLPGSASTIVAPTAFALLGNTRIPLETRQDHMTTGRARWRILLEPRLLKEAFFLHLRFQLQRSPQWYDRFRLVLPAPYWGERTLVESVQWHVETAEDRVPLYWPSNAAAAQGWRWGWGLEPPVARPMTESLAQPDAAIASPSPGRALPVWSFAQLGSPTAFEMIHAPRRLWVFGCSLVLVLIVTGAYAASARVAGYLLAFLVLAAGGVALVAPTIALALAYGIQPGLPVTLLAVGWLAWRQQRWRRQAVHLAGFRRGPGTERTRIRQWSSSQVAIRTKSVGSSVPSSVR